MMIWTLFHLTQDGEWQIKREGSILCDLSDLITKIQFAF